MGKGLSDYLIPAGFGGGFVTYNVARLSELPSQQFLTMRIEEMELFLDNHGKPVKCSSCLLEVFEGSDLVRVQGDNYHNRCFLDAYDSLRPGMKKHVRDYFDLVRDSLVDDAPTRN